jgi:hypothetical protein
MSETSRHWRSVVVPAAQAGSVLEALVAAYAVRADGLAAAARGGGSVGDARRELAEVEDVLDAVEWGVAERLSGPAGLVREVLYGALVASVEACGQRCQEYEAGLVGASSLAAAVRDVGVLYEVFAGVEEAEAL